MRICIDATALLLRSAGIKNYLYYWMRSLLSTHRSIDITAFPLLGDMGASGSRSINVNALSQTYPRIAVLQFINKIFKPAINVAVPNVDVFHASNQVHAIPTRREADRHHLRHDLPADAAVSHSGKCPRRIPPLRARVQTRRWPDCDLAKREGRCRPAA